MSEPRKSAELRAIESGNRVRARFKDQDAVAPHAGPIGKVPGYLNGDQRLLWHELRDIIAPGVLQTSDAAAFEQLVILKASERQVLIEWNRIGAPVLDPPKGKARPQSGYDVLFPLFYRNWTASDGVTRANTGVVPLYFSGPDYWFVPPAL